MTGACLILALAACRNDEHSGSSDSETCYSPTQNLDQAYEADADGCACGKKDSAVCIPHGGKYVALFCRAGSWASGFDGPCQVYGETCYAPYQNLDQAYEPDAKGCVCRDTDEDQCIDGVALICEGDTWQAVEDGPCWN